MSMKAIESLKSHIEEYTKMSWDIGSLPCTYVDIPKEVLVADVRRVERELEREYMKLPISKDGKPICVGDTLVDYDTPRKAVAVTSDSIMMGGYPRSGE